MASFVSLQEAVAANTRDGDIVALEGFTHLIPYAAGHELIRQQRRGLTLVRMTPDIIYDQLIGMGAAEKLIFSWGGNPGVGSLYRMRDAIENGWPRPLAIEEHSHAAMANAYEAGAANLPFAAFRGYLGADLAKVNPKIKSVTCPYTGEVLATVPAIRPDVAIIHAQKADRAGNVLIEGIVGVQKQAVLAAKRSIVTVEERVESFAGVHSNACILPALDRGRHHRRPGRRPSLLCPGLLHARQRLLPRLGRDLEGARRLPRLDEGECAGQGARSLPRPCRRAPPWLSPIAPLK